MKIELEKEEKVALLRAVSTGVLDTSKIERIATEIKGSNAFLELMKSLPEPEYEEQD